jgi:hypothetical protein
MNENTTVESMKNAYERFAAVAGKTVIVITEVAVIVFLGSLIGSYINSANISDDCKHIGMAKAGNNYLQCAVIEPKKDLSKDLPEPIVEAPPVVPVAPKPVIKPIVRHK